MKESRYAARRRNGSRLKVESLEERHLLDAGPLPTLPPLTHFSSLADFDGYFLGKAQTQYQSDFGQPVQVLYNPYPAAAAQAFSSAQETQNTGTIATLVPGGQTTGVNGGDIVASDGANLFELSGDQLIVQSTPPDGGLDIITHIPVPGIPIAEFLDGTRLTIVSNPFPGPIFYPISSGGTQQARYYLPSSQVSVSVYDVSNPATPKMVQDSFFDGSYQGGYAIGADFYLVLQNALGGLSAPEVVSDGKGGFAYESFAVYSARVTPQIPDLVLPHVYDPSAPDPETPIGLLSQPTDVYQPRFPTDNGLESVLTFNMTATGTGLTDVQTIIMNSVSAVYATADHLYLASSSVSSGGNASQEETVVQRFDLEGAHVAPGPAGLAPGTVVSGPSALDEQNGDLRIATTDQFSNQNGSGVYVLRQEGDDLVIVGSVTGIAPGEFLRAVRFAGDRVYLDASSEQFVPDEAADPFVIVDLSDPTNPQVVGQVEAPGDSTDLLILDANHILGVGTGGDQFNNVQLTLYDVSDPQHPTVVDQTVITQDPPPPSGGDNTVGTTYSEAESDARALTYFANEQLVALPVHGALPLSNYGDDTSSELFVFHVDFQTGFQLVGRIRHDTAVRRSLVQDGFLISVADGSTQIHALNDLGGLGKEVRVNDIPRLVQYPTIQMQPGQTFLGSLLDFTVTDPTGLTAFVYWGDGITDPASVIPSDNDRYSIVDQQHSIPVLGTFQLTIAIERDGKTVATFYTSAQVGNLDGQSEYFLRRLYLGLLNRVIDPTALNAWGAGLEQGWSRGFVALSIIQSSEYGTNQIDSLYGRYLHRQVEASGLSAWLGYLAAGHSIDEVSAAILGSPEYFANQAGSNVHDFVGDLYNDVLASVPDPGGQLVWETDLNQGASRMQVALAFLHSDQGTRKEVYTAFQTLLDRNPEGQALDFFTAALQNGATPEAIEAAILGSQEYLQKN